MAFRDALGRFATGVAVVTRRDAQLAPIGITINSFTSVSLEPPLVLWCIDNSSPKLSDFLADGAFALSVLHEDQAALCWRFASAEQDPFATQDGIKPDTAVPQLSRALAVFHCRLWQTHQAGDHHIVLGEVEAFECQQGRPLIFSQGQLARSVPLKQE